MEIYIHLPFCVQKCRYCDFLSFPAEEERQRVYIDALLQEIRRTAERTGSCEDGDPVKPVSVFLGGGTPSLLPAEWIGEILEELRSCFPVSADAEITIEANPGTVDTGKLQMYRSAGINRISFGCQSFQEQELKLLGRIHTVREIRESVRLAREAGFDNINMDLMSGLPGQDLKSWEETLHQAVVLEPEHISAYSLIIEEGTPFFTQYGEKDNRCSEFAAKDKAGTEENGFPALPDEETERRMYERTAEILAEAGFRQYEISNYAREGYACRHNLGYWTGIPYFGFGLGASGYLPQSWFSRMQAGNTGSEEKEPLNEESGTAQRWVRYRNTCDFIRYTDGISEYDEVQVLDQKDLQAEFMILGLRLTEGVEDAGFRRRFGCSLDTVYGEILKKYSGMGFLVRKDGRTYLSRKGISVSNTVLADFL